MELAVHALYAQRRIHDELHAIAAIELFGRCSHGIVLEHEMPVRPGERTRGVHVPDSRRPGFGNDRLVPGSQRERAGARAVCADQHSALLDRDDHFEVAA